MAAADPYAQWSLFDRLQMLAFEAELAHLPRSLISGIWEALDSLELLDFSAPARPAESPQLMRGPLGWTHKYRCYDAWG